jgi:hypothetical protein
MKRAGLLGKTSFLAGPLVYQPRSLISLREVVYARLVTTCGLLRGPLNKTASGERGEAVLSGTWSWRSVHLKDAHLTRLKRENRPP